MKKLLTIILFLQSLLPGYAQSLTDGEYMIKINQTGKYLAIAGAATNNGAWAIQWDMEVKNHFLFNVKKIGNDIYSLQAKHSGRFLSSDGESPKRGAKVLQWDWLGQDNQKWIITRADNGVKGWKVRCLKNSMRLVIQDWNTVTTSPGNGAYFMLTNDETSPFMLVDFKRNETDQIKSDNSTFNTGKQVQTVNINKPSIGTRILADVQDGIYKIRINESGKYLAIAGEEDNNNGMRLIQWDMLPRNNHLFDVRRLDNGNYSISPLHSQKLLDVVDMKTEDGTQIQQWENLNGSNQQWKFYNAKNGLSIISVASGKGLQLSTGITNNANGTPLIISGSSTQTFALLPARANKFTEIITLKDLQFAVPHGGDLEMFGLIKIYLVNKQGNSFSRYYLNKNNTFFNKHEKEGIDMDKKRNVSFDNELKFQINSDELSGAEIIIVYGINENDADVASLFTQFGGAIDPYTDPNKAIPVEKEPYYAGGSDDFYKLKYSFNDCLKSKLSSYGHTTNNQSFYVSDIPGSCKVHVNLQDEDGSDNWLDIYFTVSKERKF